LRYPITEVSESSEVSKIKGISLSWFSDVIVDCDVTCDASYYARVGISTFKVLEEDGEELMCGNSVSVMLHFAEVGVQLLTKSVSFTESLWLLARSQGWPYMKG